MKKRRFGTVIALSVIVILGSLLTLWMVDKHQKMISKYKNYSVEKISVSKPQKISWSKDKTFMVQHYRQYTKDGRLWSCLVIDSPKEMTLDYNNFFLDRGRIEPFNSYQPETIKINGKHTLKLSRGLNKVLAYSEYSYKKTKLKLVIMQHTQLSYEQFFFEENF